MAFIVLRADEEKKWNPKKKYWISNMKQLICADRQSNDSALFVSSEFVASPSRTDFMNLQYDWIRIYLNIRLPLLSWNFFKFCHFISDFVINIERRKLNIKFIYKLNEYENRQFSREKTKHVECSIKFACECHFFALVLFCWIKISVSKFNR